MEAHLTATGVETLASAFSDVVRIHRRLLAAAAAAVGTGVVSTACAQLAAELRAVLQTIEGDSPSGANATPATTPPSPPADELVDVARVQRYEEALRTAAGHARGALGDVPRVRREWGHVGGRPGPLDKSAKSADEVRRNHDRLVPVSAPSVELVMAAAAAPPTQLAAARPPAGPAPMATGAGGMSLDGTIGGSPLGERVDNVASQDVVAAPAGLPEAVVAAGSGGRAARSGGKWHGRATCCSQARPLAHPGRGAQSACTWAGGHGLDVCVKHHMRMHSARTREST